MNVSKRNISHLRFVLQSATNMKNIIFIALFHLISFNAAKAQVDIVHQIVVNNDTSIRLLTQSKTKKSIIFFCPTANISKDFYFKKSEELSKNHKLKDLSDLTLYFIYFKQDTKNNSKGVKYTDNNNKDTIFIGQFECLFIGFDMNLLIRAKNKMKYNYDVTRAFGYENVWKVPIVDTNKCFEKMQDRIPFYADFIREVCIPNYSVDEKIQFLRDTISDLSRQLIFLQKEVEKLKPISNQEIEKGNNVPPVNDKNSDKNNLDKPKETIIEQKKSKNEE